MSEKEIFKIKNEHVEFLLEEPSMENLLRELLPKILPSGYELNINCFLRPHQGNSDLKKSIPKKIKVFSKFHIPARVVIVQDQDFKNCKALKAELLDLCHQNGNCPVMVRIPCRELENWYLGDMAAIEKIYPKFKAKLNINRAKFRIIDNCKGSHELKKIIKDFQKGFASKNISKYLDLNFNRSVSFNHFISGVKKFLIN